MSLSAVGFGSVGASEGVSGEQVVDVGDGAEVSWVDAVPDAAYVVDFEAIRDGAVGFEVGDAVGVLLSREVARVSSSVAARI